MKYHRSNICDNGRKDRDKFATLQLKRLWTRALDTVRLFSIGFGTFDKEPLLRQGAGIAERPWTRLVDNIATLRTEKKEV